MKRKGHVFLLFVAVCFAALSAGCSLFGFNSATATLDFGSVSSNFRGSRSISAASRGVTEEGGTVLDGLRVWVKAIRAFRQPEANGSTIWESPDGEAGTLVDMRSEGDVARLTEHVSIAAGTYVQIGIGIQDKLEIKAKTQAIGGTWYYTTATGIVQEATVDPAKYDFYAYPFVYMSTGDPYDNNTVSQWENVDIPESFTVDKKAQYRLNILVDLMHLVYFWNGEGEPNIRPFKFGSNNPKYTAADYFPPGQPHFGARYIPIAMAITDVNDTSADVTIETYGAYPESKGDIVDDNAPDLTVMTIAYMNAATKVPYWARLRNFDDDLTDLLQFFSDFQPNTSQTGFNCTNREYYIDSEFGYRQIKDFPRLSPGEKSTFTADSYDQNGQFVRQDSYILKRLK